jgi:hypothetical protein
MENNKHEKSNQNLDHSNTQSSTHISDTVPHRMDNPNILQRVYTILLRKMDASFGSLAKHSCPVVVPVLNSHFLNASSSSGISSSYVLIIHLVIFAIDVTQNRKKRVI